MRSDSQSTQATKAAMCDTTVPQYTARNSGLRDGMKEHISRHPSAANKAKATRWVPADNRSLFF